MKIINKDKIINTTKRVINKTILKVKDVFSKTKDDVYYLLDSQKVKIIKHPSKESINKPIFVILDDKNNKMFVKKHSLFPIKDYLIKDCIIKTKNDIEYKVNKISKKTSDYLLKENKQYKKISCYEIELEKAI